VIRRDRRRARLDSFARKLQQIGAQQRELGIAPRSTTDAIDEMVRASRGA